MAAVVVAVIVVVGVMLLTLVFVAPSPVTVTVTGLGFEWDSPPSSLCTTFGFNDPGVPFTVNASAQFNVSWYETCQASGPVGTYTITSVSSVYDIPFSIVGSNVPVTLQWGNYSWFNVTLQAPNYAWSGQLFVFITAN